MESRAKEYDTLRIQFRELRTSFRDIINLDDFKGKTAESVKGFYRAQIDVVDAWLDFIDLQEAFLKGIKGLANDVDLGEDTLVHLPFLDNDLKNSENRARQIVDGQEQALQDIFSGIEDIMSIEPYSTKRFDKHIDEATKKRKETKEKVESLDQTLVEHYEQSKYHENIIVGLISELYQASMQGGEVNPLYFNEDTYRNSDIHTAKEEAKKITAEYISWQDELEKARELENRSFGEKTWDTICTFTGEVTGYYDMKRATTGIGPVTGEELTGGQRATAAALAAAGFIPFVGWAGRAVKGGHAIYKTSKTFKAADNALDAYRTTEAFDILRKTEYGLYGLASANGFSEYITGKDMFGQELTEQQRQSSLTQSILVLAAGGGSVVVDRVQAKNTVNHLFPTPNPLKKQVEDSDAVKFTKNDKDFNSSFSGDSMDPLEAARYDDYWRNLGIGSDATYNEFIKRNPKSNIDDYLKIVKDASPWPDGYSPKSVTLKPGDTFEMALSKGQNPQTPGRFGTDANTIEDINYVRDNLAVKNEWKPTLDKVVQYRVKDGMSIPALEGPVGPQIDLGVNKYLDGGANQVNLLVDRNTNMMDYLEIVSVRPID